MVDNLKTSNVTLLNAVQRLEETNSSLVTTVASLSHLASIVEKHGAHVRKFKQMPPKTPVQPAQPTAIECDKDGDEEPAEIENVQGSSNVTPEFSIPLDMLRRVEKTDARKMTNDLHVMHGLYSEDFMASHPVCGLGMRAAMPHSEVSAIISAVLGEFGDAIRT